MLPCASGPATYSTLPNHSISTLLPHTTPLSGQLYLCVCDRLSALCPVCHMRRTNTEMFTDVPLKHEEIFSRTIAWSVSIQVASSRGQRRPRRASLRRRCSAARAAFLTKSAASF